MTKLTVTLLLLAWAFAAYFGQSNAQFEGLQLAGASGTYGQNETEWVFCHDAPTGWYNYNYPLGLGFGFIQERPEGGWLAEGVWVECGSVGQERIIFFPNGTVFDTWWFETEGDSVGAIGFPVIIEKSNDTIPAAEQCYWLNKDVSLNLTGGIDGLWDGGPGVSFNVCTVGTKYARGAWNETDNGVHYAGYASGANFLNIVFTGTFTEVKQISDDCVQGCQIDKLGGDGTVLFEKYWCTLFPFTDPFASTEYIYRKTDSTASGTEETGSNTTSTSENAICYFAALPIYGWTTTQLANSTFP